MSSEQIQGELIGFRFRSDDGQFAVAILREERPGGSFRDVPAKGALAHLRVGLCV